MLVIHKVLYTCSYLDLRIKLCESYSKGVQCCVFSFLGMPQAVLLVGAGVQPVLSSEVGIQVT